ncbi:Cu(I)-responsive transcriptional regulator [Rhodoligotrophos appendicifer]|uniref:Cu(I)-responsive transcriptional regulator n=1 Tax=Rhodoligotrophos appendicifer TaxID=987056 RepID=UPI001186EB29|nr:Cu(I)-responsive transcriptional regulator [Rhodoligotrophos appendicifer]
MQIGEAARVSNVSAKMIRNYEGIGLVPAADRRDSNYRDYGPKDVARLSFIRRSRDLGFSLKQISELLKLWEDQDRTSFDVKALALNHVQELEEKSQRLHEMANLLRKLADACEGDARPNCPILRGLEHPI